MHTNLVHSFPQLHVNCLVPTLLFTMLLLLAMVRTMSEVLLLECKTELPCVWCSRLETATLVVVQAAVETPFVEEATVDLETPVVEEATVDLETPVVEEATVDLETPVVVEATPVDVEATVDLETPVVEEATADLETPVVVEDTVDLSIWSRSDLSGTWAGSIGPLIMENSSG